MRSLLTCFSVPLAIQQACLLCSRGMPAGVGSSNSGMSGGSEDWRNMSELPGENGDGNGSRSSWSATKLGVSLSTNYEERRERCKSACMLP